MAGREIAAQTSVASLSPTEVGQLIDGMRDLADHLRGSTWTVISGWGSFFARFLHVRSDRGVELAIKFGKGWTAADTECVVAEIGRVRRLFAALPGGHVEVPPALGWSPGPAMIALPYVAGDNLFTALGESTHPLHAAGGQLDTIMRSAGQALGAYHSAETVPDDPEVRRVARLDMEAAARRSGFRSSLVDRLEREIAVVRGYRLSHNDFTVGEPVQGGPGLTILDPPHVRKFDHLHRDLSAFTLALHRALIGERHLTSPDRVYVRLQDSFLEGYRTTGPVTLETDLDRWLLQFYELSRVGSQLVGRIRGRQPAPTMRSVRWWAAKRRALGSAPAF